jgi:hypothetical protein
MTGVPARPKIYHITHIDNLANILRDGGLWSDAKRIELGLQCEIVGMSSIKKRRLEELIVKCHPPDLVGEYVPFYFCPRSIMLYILYRADHPELTYRGGQDPIVHLQADLYDTIAWSNQAMRSWAFTDRNAGAYVAEFFCDAAELDHVNWDAVDARLWADFVTREGKQAEFLLRDYFPWHLVERIGVHDSNIMSRAAAALAALPTQSTLSVEPSWYY